MKSVTRVLFLAALAFSIIWVCISYGIAIYATVRLEQPFPVTELSGQAINTIIGTTGLKVLENIFEHNNGPLFGHTKETEDTYGKD